MINLRTIAGAIAAGLAGYALLRAFRSPEARADNPAKPAPPGCVADGTGPASGKCDRCGRKLRNVSTRLQCDSGVVAYCGPKCAADWIDRNKTDLPEPPFWTPPAAKCCTQSLDAWNAEEMRGKRSRRDQINAFAEEATGQNWRPDRKGGLVSTAKVLKGLAKEKRQLYKECQQMACDGNAYIEALEPWGVATDVFRDKPNLWTFRAAQQWRGAPDVQVRYNKGVWKLQRSGRTISTATDSETIAALAQAYLGDRAPAEQTTRATIADEPPEYYGSYEPKPTPPAEDYDILDGFDVPF